MTIEFRLAPMITCAVFMAAMVNPALASGGVVIASSAESYPIGFSMDDDAILSLADDTSVAVMLTSGRVIKINGPYEGLLADEEAAVESVMAKLGKVLLETDEGEEVIGGIRAAPPQPDEE